jgi:3-isopropylmalate dehydrogenase
MRKLEIAVLPGDGIGQEIMPPCLDLLTMAAEKTGGFHLNYQHLEGGAALYQRTGDAFPEETFSAAAGADAILFGAMGLPDVRYPDGREIAPQLDLRERLHLYAGLRPAKTMPGLPPVLADPRAEQLDLVIVRESTEGLFSARTSGDRDGDQAARDTLLITRPVCEKLCEFSFRLARKRRERGKPGTVTCVDKSNVLGSFAFFREIFVERSRLFPEIESNYCYVDAMAMNLVKQPWNFDVLVTENMFGDILSDQAAALVGGMGMAPSADIGDQQAVFQPCHGSAPDIAGSGKANPTAMFLSAALMLDWLGEQYNVLEACLAADVLNHAIESAFAGGDLIPYEFGGNVGLREVFDAVSAKLAVINLQNE